MSADNKIRRMTFAELFGMPVVVGLFIRFVAPAIYHSSSSTIKKDTIYLMEDTPRGVLMSYVVYATVCALALAVPILLLRWIVSRFKWLSIFRNREEFLFAFIVASLFGLMIAYSGNREAWFKNELNRRLTPYQGEANSDRTSRRGGIVLWFHFAKDVLKDEDLPTIVEIIKFARTVHWRQRFNLVLDSINVTDAGLRNLESLPEDVHVILMNTSVSREGANWLREKRSFGVFWEEPKSDESKR